MNCNEVGSLLSAIHDGESVPINAARHVASCAKCKSKLESFSQIGIQLRIASNLHSNAAPLTAAWRNRRLEVRSWFAFLFCRVAVPRFALGVIIAALIALSVTLSVVRAQTPALWFGFGFSTTPEELRTANIAQNGNKTDFTTFTFESSVVPHGNPRKPVAIGVHLEVINISSNVVSLRVNSRLYHFPNDQMDAEASSRTAKQAATDLASGGEVIQYVPGEVIEVPVQGGGRLYLKGFVQDHQPKVAWGLPLELAAAELAVRSPILIQGKKVIFESGASGIVDDKDHGITLSGGANGTYIFGLRPFAGAVKGQANWGELNFQLDGKEYRLVVAAPLTGGDQPRSVWVGFNPAPSVWSQALGSDKLP